MSMYYIARPGGEKQGPFPEATVRANLLHPGHYADDTLVWSKGMDTWKPLRSIFGSAAEAKPAPLVPKLQTKYFIAERGGKAQGPYSLPALLRLAYPCTEHTLVWHKGMKDWEPIASVPGVAILAANKAAPGSMTPVEPSFWQVIFPPFSGRTTRTEFIASVFAVIVVWFVGVPLVLSIADSIDIDILSAGLSLLCVAIVIASVIHLMLKAARRLHDIGLSALFLIFFAIPIIGWIPFAVTALMPGTKGRNSHGPNPRGDVS